MSFGDYSVKFFFDDPSYQRLEVIIESWNSVEIKKADGNHFKFHESDAPKWASASNKTQDYGDTDFIPF